MNLSNKITSKSRKIAFGWESFPWLLPLIVIGVIGVFYNTLPNRVPFYYSLPWGTDQLASKKELFLLPVIGLFVNAINSIFIYIFKNKSNHFLSRVMFVSSVLCNLLGGITIIQIIRVII